MSINTKAFQIWFYHVSHGHLLIRQPKAEAVGVNNEIVLHNDDVNTFDHVIDTLIRVCNHDDLQAEQCAILVHYKGKCTVKTGSLEVLKPMHEQLLARSLTSEIV